MSPAPQRRPSARPASGRGPRRSGGSQKSAAQGRYDAAEELHPIDTPPDIESFDHWPLDPMVARAIRSMEIAVPTPIQRLAIGPVLEGRDVIAKAETGTGKTLAFGAPMVSKLDAGRASVLGLVLCPTRELAQQVANVLRALGQEKGLKVALVVGGDPMQPQIKELQAGAQLVVGTPGRVLDLMKQRFLSFPWTEFAVLDEADEMLEIGFLDDVEAILNATPEERQTLLFSATFPPPLLALARKHTKNPIELATARGVATVDRIAQSVCFTSEEDRPHELRRLLLASSPSDLFLIFCDRRMEVDRLMRRLERLPVAVKALHGGYDQEARFRVMSAFRGGEVRALVATDVASRGLDVTGVTHVINFSPPRDISDYTHRIGRTGRAGRHGKALTFVAGGDQRRWGELTARMTWPVEEVEPRQLVRQLLAPPLPPPIEAPETGRADAQRAERPQGRERAGDPRRDASAGRDWPRRTSPVPADPGEEAGRPEFETPPDPRRRASASPEEARPSERRRPQGSGAARASEAERDPRSSARSGQRDAAEGQSAGQRPGASRAAARRAEPIESERPIGSGQRRLAGEPGGPMGGRERAPSQAAAPSGQRAPTSPRAQPGGPGPADPRELFETRRRERAERIRRDREQRRLALGLAGQERSETPDPEGPAGRSGGSASAPRPPRQPHLGLAPRDRMEREPDELQERRDPRLPLGRAAAEQPARAPRGESVARTGRGQAETGAALREESAAAQQGRPRAKRPTEPRAGEPGLEPGSESRPRGAAQHSPGRQAWPADSAEGPPRDPRRRERDPERTGGSDRDPAAGRPAVRPHPRSRGRSDESDPSQGQGPLRRPVDREPSEGSRYGEASRPSRPPVEAAAPEGLPDPTAVSESGGRRRRSRRGPPPEIETPPIHGRSTPADQGPGLGGFGEGL
jgi:ATP-dependent RNA helicase DeaD